MNIDSQKICYEGVSFEDSMWKHSTWKTLGGTADTIVLNAPSAGLCCRKINHENPEQYSTIKYRSSWNELSHTHV